MPIQPRPDLGGTWHPNRISCHNLNHKSCHVPSRITSPLSAHHLENKAVLPTDCYLALLALPAAFCFLRDFFLFFDRTWLLKRSSHEILPLTTDTALSFYPRAFQCAGRSHRNTWAVRPPRMFPVVPPLVPRIPASPSL